jgi:hypothetical protein
VTASAVRDWIGTDQVRSYSFHDDRMTLTMHHPGDRYIALVWQKVGSRLPQEAVPDQARAV